jgi:hypothetical protein
VRREARLSAVRGHVVVAGFGPAGERVVSALRSVGATAFVLDLNRRCALDATGPVSLDAPSGTAPYLDALEVTGALDVRLVVPYSWLTGPGHADWSAPAFTKSITLHDTWYPLPVAPPAGVTTSGGLAEWCGAVADATWYLDADQDSYGDPVTWRYRCSDPSGGGTWYVQNALDVDDANPNCTTDPTDVDRDGWCVPEDCDDATAGCNADCTNADGDALRACDGDCSEANAWCTTDCTDADQDGTCATTDCDEGNATAWGTWRGQSGWCRPRTRPCSAKGRGTRRGPRWRSWAT